MYSLPGNRNRLGAIINLGAKYLFLRHSHNAIVGETPAIIKRHPKKLDAE